jgi:small conductance mechanosensitive channel
MNPTDKIQEGITMAQKVYDTVIELLIKYGFQVLGGFIIIFIGFKLAHWVRRLFENFCHKKNLDITLTQFLSGIIGAVVMVFAALMALEKFGVTISPLIASVSALIFGASFAIQAPLSNYAAGLSVILTRPFVVGNTITVQGVSGVVEEVKLPCTILVTGDGEKITIPNKDIVGQILHNSHEFKVAEKMVGISYSDSPEQAIQVIAAVLNQHADVSKTITPQVGIENFGDSSINIQMRYWVPTKDYFKAMYSVNLAVYTALKEAKITIPFPQREIRMLNG